MGAAIAYGAAKSGSAVTLLDQGDVAYRASRGNFGLVWLQSKGAGFPRYARWSRDAVDHWDPLASELRELTGVDVDLQQNGGFWIGFSEKEVAEREAMLRTMAERFPHITAIAMDTAARTPSGTCEPEGEFDFTLDLLLDAFERLHAAGWTSSA